MMPEVYKATLFLLKFIKSKNCLSETQMLKLRDALISVMCSRYEDHWFPRSPMRGSGYRCIRINQNLDPVISTAGNITGLPLKMLRSLLPLEFTMWVDPDEVSYRIGENGSICVVENEDIQDIAQQMPETHSRFILIRTNCSRFT